MSQLHHNISSDAYNEFLSDVATAVQEHRVQAIQSVQTISNQLYWTIGELIIKKQEEFGWGKSVILLLSQDLPQLIWRRCELVSPKSSVYEAIGSRIFKCETTGFTF